MKQEQLPLARRDLLRGMCDFAEGGDGQGFFGDPEKEAPFFINNDTRTMFHPGVADKFIFMQYIKAHLQSPTCNQPYSEFHMFHDGRELFQWFLWDYEYVLAKKKESEQ